MFYQPSVVLNKHQVMKKRNFKLPIILIFLITLSGFNKMNGQSYSFNPGLVYTTYVDTSANNFGGIEIQNTGTQNLNLTWKKVLVDTLIDSYFQICNSGICSMNLPKSGLLPQLLPGDIGWIKFHMFSGKVNGLNTIKYVLKNGTIQSDTLTFKIYVVSGLTGLKELNNVKDQAVLFPNPTTNGAIINLNLTESSDVSLNTLNPLGQCVYKDNIHYDLGLNTINIDTKNYDSGIYTIVLQTKNGIITKKLTVTK